MTDESATGPLLGRREATRLMVLASVGAAATPFAAATGAESACPFADGGGELLAFMKLQSRADDGYTDYLNAGTVYAAIAGRQSIPLYRYEGLLRFHTRVTGTERYDVTFIEAGTYLDLATGQRIDRFQNPISGAVNTVDHIVEGPMTWQWTTENLTVANPMPILRRRVAWQEFDGQSWLQFDNIITGGAPGDAFRHAAALVTYVGSTVQLRDPSRASVSDTVLIDSSINPWAPWLKMDDAPGRLSNNIIGRKLGAMSETPARLLDCIRATHPEVLRGVEGWKPVA